ncbi:MAG TPA: hypothetical protein VGE99_01230 [Candidatus Dormibacteraeota bacterium]
MDVLIASASSFAGPHAAADTSGGVHLELWQVINLLGAPVLAIIFAQPVIADLRAWFTRPE